MFSFILGKKSEKIGNCTNSFFVATSYITPSLLLMLNMEMRNEKEILKKMLMNS